MPIITIKNVPDEVKKRLKELAKQDKRSLTKYLIVLFEAHIKKT